jgi:hypothetical protein
MPNAVSTEALTVILACRIGYDRLGKAEVENFDHAVWRDSDVRRFEIAVENTLLVRGVHRVGDLPGDGQGAIDRKRRARCRTRSDDLCQSLARHQLHHEGQDTVCLLQSVHLRDVWVIECRQQPGLALETRAARRVVGERRRQDLDGDRPFQSRIERAIDFSHPAGVDQRLDRVLANLAARHCWNVAVRVA